MHLPVQLTVAVTHPPALMVMVMLRVLSALAVVDSAFGHGALTFPPPRNNYGRVNPANRSEGNPVTGKWSHLPPSHI
eukprot:COSAG02_NODE_15386_length_1175_cov_1.350372_2_plen_76_part_01